MLPEKTKLGEALQQVFKILRENYPASILIVNASGADLYLESGEKHIFNQEMLEKYMTGPMLGLMNNMLNGIMDMEKENE